MVTIDRVGQDEFDEGEILGDNTVKNIDEKNFGFKWKMRKEEFVN